MLMVEKLKFQKPALYPKIEPFLKFPAICQPYFYIIMTCITILYIQCTQNLFMFTSAQDVCTANQ